MAYECVDYWALLLEIFDIDFLEVSLCFCVTNVRAELTGVYNADFGVIRPRRYEMWIDLRPCNNIDIITVDPIQLYGGSNLLDFLLT